MKIIINNEELTIKYTIRALFVFEKITNKMFSLNGILDLYIYFYSVILACNPDTELDFNEFINYCDSNPNLINEFRKWLEVENNKQAQFIDNNGETEIKKKSSI